MVHFLLVHASSKITSVFVHRSQLSQRRGICWVRKPKYGDRMAIIEHSSGQGDTLLDCQGRQGELASGRLLPPTKWVNHKPASGMDELLP